MMYTNSTLIDREAARRMAELGNITPAISVEGWEKETDERRGAGVFRKIQRAMENLREAGVPFGVSVTGTRKNAETVLSDEFMDYYFRQQGAVYGWLFQYMPIGRSFDVDLMVTAEQRKWMLEKELRLIFERDLFLIDFWNGGPMSLGCISAGRSGGYFYIDWNGNVAPCVFFPVLHREHLRAVPLRAEAERRAGAGLLPQDPRLAGRLPAGRGQGAQSLHALPDARPPRLRPRDGEGLRRQAHGRGRCPGDRRSAVPRADDEVQRGGRRGAGPPLGEGDLLQQPQALI